MQKKIDWNFKCINPCDYEMQLDMIAENKLILIIFNKARISLAKKKSISVHGNPDNITSFNVEPKFYSAIKTILSPVIRDVQGAVNLNGIFILNSFVKNAKFKREADEDWLISINLTGQYVDKR